MRAMQSAGFPRIKPFMQILGVPQIQITNLRAFDRRNAKKRACRRIKTAGIARCNDHFIGFYGELAQCLQSHHIGLG